MFATSLAIPLTARLCRPFAALAFNAPPPDVLGVAAACLLAILIGLIAAPRFLRRHVRHATEPLRDSEQRFRDVVEYARDAAYKINVKTRRYEYMSPVIQKLSGFTDIEVLSMAPEGYSERMNGGDRRQIGPDFARLVEPAGPTHVTVEYRWRHRDGDWRWFSDSRACIRDARGAPLTLVGTIRDVTRRRRLEEELRQSQKMDAIGHLAGGVAHDFKNLLQAIIAYNETMLRETPEDDPRRKQMWGVRAVTERAARLTRQLLAFSRRQVLEFEELDLDCVIAAMLDMLERVLSDNISIDFSPVDGMPPVYGDRGEIEHILLNLVLNARDAMPDGGRIVIVTEYVSLGETYCASNHWARPGRYMRLLVRDTGQGMSAEVLEQIFEPFFTTKEPEEGTGLGLATVYGIIKQHKGFVNATSEMGVGTAFEVYLPVADRDTTFAESTAPDATQCEAKSRRTILVAEDESIVRELATQVVEDAGYRVLGAADGEQAVEVFNRHPDQIDLVILDVLMPKLNGPQAFKRIREMQPEIPVLFSTGFSGDVLGQDLVRQNHVRCLEKPFTPDALVKAVHEMLGEF